MVVVLQHKKHSKLHTAKRLTKISDLLTVQLKKKASKKSTFYFRCAIDGFELEIIHQREPSNLTRKDFHKSCPSLVLKKMAASPQYASSASVVLHARTTIFPIISK